MVCVGLCALCKVPPFNYGQSKAWQVFFFFFRLNQWTQVSGEPHCSRSWSLASFQWLLGRLHSAVFPNSPNMEQPSLLK